MDIAQYDLFRAGDLGYHTWRIPALVTTPGGAMLAFAEARRNSRADSGDIDLAMRRSFDGGRSWEAVRIIHDAGENTAGNPAPVVDLDSGDIILLWCLNNERVFVMRSSNVGETWSAPQEITEFVKKPSWTWYATGPCHGIHLSSRRLLIPCDHIGGPRKEWNVHSHSILSDDGGRTWRIGGVLDAPTNECVAVELPDRSVYMNMRSYAGLARRAVSWSDDGGESWLPIRHDETLVEPICQASAIRYVDESKEIDCVIFSNPDSADRTERVRMTLRASFDGCQTWPKKLLVNEGQSAYSDLAITPDNRIACLYERGEKIPYDKITLAIIEPECIL